MNKYWHALGIAALLLIAGWLMPTNSTEAKASDEYTVTMKVYLPGDLTYEGDSVIEMENGLILHEDKFTSGELNGEGNELTLSLEEPVWINVTDSTGAPVEGVECYWDFMCETDIHGQLFYSLDIYDVDFLELTHDSFTMTLPIALVPKEKKLVRAFINQEGNSSDEYFAQMIAYNQNNKVIDFYNDWIYRDRYFLIHKDSALLELALTPQNARAEVFVVRQNIDSNQEIPVVEIDLSPSFVRLAPIDVSSNNDLLFGALHTPSIDRREIPVSIPVRTIENMAAEIIYISPELISNESIVTIFYNGESTSYVYAQQVNVGAQINPIGVNSAEDFEFFQEHIKIQFDPHQYEDLYLKGIIPTFRVKQTGSDIGRISLPLGYNAGDQIYFYADDNISFEPEQIEYEWRRKSEDERDPSWVFALNVGDSDIWTDDAEWLLNFSDLYWAFDSQTENPVLNDSIRFHIVDQSGGQLRQFHRVIFNPTTYMEDYVPQTFHWQVGDQSGDLYSGESETFPITWIATGAGAFTIQTSDLPIESEITTEFYVQPIMRDTDSGRITIEGILPYLKSSEAEDISEAEVIELLEFIDSYYYQRQEGN